MRPWARWATRSTHWKGRSPILGRSKCTFYVFAHLRDLPPPLDDGMELFRRALDDKVISVPGVFFDVNPGGRRSSFLCRFHQYVRLSFGPEIGQGAAGLDRPEGLIGRARAGG